MSHETSHPIHISSGVQLVQETCIVLLVPADRGSFSYCRKEMKIQTIKDKIRHTN